MKAISPIHQSSYHLTMSDDRWFMEWTRSLAELDPIALTELASQPRPSDEVFMVLGLDQWSSQIVGLLGSPLLSLNQKENQNFISQVRRCIQILVNSGCSPNATSRAPGRLPLLHRAPLYVASCLPLPIALKIIEALIEVGADPNQKIRAASFGVHKSQEVHSLIEVMLRTASLDVYAYLENVVKVESDRSALIAIVSSVPVCSSASLKEKSADTNRRRM